MEGNKSISTRTTRVESLFFSFTRTRKRRRRLFFLVEFLVRSYGERKCLRHCWWDNTRCVPAQKPIPQVFFFTFELILRTSRQLSSSWLVLEWVDTFLYRPSRTKGARGGERKGRHGPAADDGLLLTIISLGLWRKTLCEPWGERRRWFYEPLMSLTGCRAKLFFSSLNKILRETFSLNWERTWKVHYPTRQLTVPQYTQSGRLGGTILFAPTRQLTDSFLFLNEKYQRLAISIGSNPDYPLRGGSAFFCFLFPVSRRWN